jgi:hypothetical protein
MLIGWKTLNFLVLIHLIYIFPANPMKAPTGFWWRLTDWFYNLFGNVNG